MTQKTNNPPSILSHLHELRRRFQIAIIAYVVGVIVLMNFSSVIFDFMAIPLRSALPPHTPLVFLNAPDVFFTYLKIALVLSVFVTAPITFYQAWAFIAPGLYNHERKLFLGFFISSLVLLFLGAAFAFYAVFPMIFTFFLSFSSDSIQAMPAIKEYLTLVLKLLFAFGVSFQVPIIVIALTRLNIMDVDSLAAKRRYVIVWAFIFSAILTPPDIISQIMLAIPMYILFEVGVWVARRMESKVKHATL
ncbi:MAG: twin-arginine translocase subunit TatC [Mariprofundaceae bacterium]|nr:twin-arginine translocase subunit TatC [Mariprofundaceae bacterium]